MVSHKVSLLIAKGILLVSALVVFVVVLTSAFLEGGWVGVGVVLVVLIGVGLTIWSGIVVANNYFSS